MPLQDLKMVVSRQVHYLWKVVLWALSQERTRKSIQLEVDYQARSRPTITAMIVTIANCLMPGLSVTMVVKLDRGLPGLTRH